MVISNPNALTPEARTARVKAIEELVRSMAPPLMAEALVPGMACCIATATERTCIYLGRADASREVGRQTLFQIASASKPLSAFGIIRLFERMGRSLDEPIAPMLTSWSFPESLRAQQNVNLITMRMLLSHTSGLNIHSYPWVPAGAARHTAGDLLNGIDGPEFTLGFDLAPGVASSYSGAGFTLAQCVADDLAGSHFSQWMGRDVLPLLGMHSSSFDETTWTLAQCATRHDGEGNPMPPAFRAATAASNLYTTAEDIGRFIGTMFDGPNGEFPGRFIISAAEARNMTKPHPPGIPDPHWGMGWYMGAGMMQTTFKAGGAKAGVWTWLEGFPSSDIGIAMLTNSEAAQRVTKPIMTEIRKMLLGLDQDV